MTQHPEHVENIPSDDIVRDDDLIPETPDKIDPLDPDMPEDVESDVR